MDRPQPAQRDEDSRTAYEQAVEEAIAKGGPLAEFLLEPEEPWTVDEPEG